MPTAPLAPGHPSWESAVALTDRVERGETRSSVAREMGVPVNTALNWVKRVRQHRGTDPAILDSMQAVGTGMVPSLVWAQTKSKDGTSYSTLLKPAPVEDGVLDRIAAAFSDIPPAPTVAAPVNVMEDLLTLYPVFDAHIGMQAWGKDTRAEDYDLKIATSQLSAAFEKLFAITPNSAEAVVLIGGDYFHIDDQRNETPASKHNLDVDGRFFKVIDEGVAVLKRIIPRVLEKHERVTVRVLRGNHDEHSHLMLTYALFEHFADNPRCEVEKSPQLDLFMRQWGKCAIFAHHGDRRFKPEQAALYLSDVCEFWSATRHRHMFTGHIHHETGKDVGPMKWESLRACCPPDNYAATMGYASRRALQAMTFHRDDGLLLRGNDPIA